MLKPYLKAFLFFVCCFISSIVYGQGASNKGTDFWLGYGKHISTGKMVVYLTSDVTTTATVSIANLNFTKTVTVKANGIVTVEIPTSAHLEDDGLSENGIHITSLKPIIVYAHIFANSVSGATLVLPVSALGKEYLSINYKQISNSKGSVSWFFVVAVEDDTQIEITPSQDTEEGWEAGKTYTVTLKKGDIYNVLGKSVDVDANNANNNNIYSYGDDLTGSKIKSVSSGGTCKKIAVFSGSSKIAISCLSYQLPTSGNNISSPGAGDNFMQQAYPTETWGKNFITVPQKERNYVIYRIVKSDPTAIVKINGTAVSFPLFYDFESQNIEQISSDKPIQVVQYAVSQGKGVGCSSVSGDVGDPEMIYLNPLEQTLTNITMYSTGEFKILKHFINVVVKKAGVASFTLDGASTSASFTEVPGNSEYSYAQLSVTEGTHNLRSDVGFNAIAYGFGSAESYGYAAGANLTAFGIDPVNPNAPNSEIQTGCVGTSYDLTLKLPYEASQLQFDRGDGSGLQIISSTSFTTTQKDGQTIYTYSLIPEVTYSEAKTYSYRVLTTKPSADACGSGDEFLFDFIINKQPVGDFSAVAEVCINSPISVKANIFPDQTITEYLWIFEDGQNANTESAEYTYTSTGVKNIRLSVKSEDGCWSEVKEVETEVMPLPVANFKQQAITCVDGAVQFTDQSTITKSTITKWAWDFGDPTSSANTSTDQNPTHTFNEVETYDVTLTVTTDLGCTQTIVKPITIHPLPVVEFETPDICLTDASAKFINKSSITTGSISYVWDFGDNNSTSANNTSTDKDPSHTYTEAKVYQVTLTATSASGCVTTLTKPFTVNGSTPVAKFAVQNENQLFSDQEVVFEDLASVDFGQVTKIEWIYDTSTPSEIETDDNPATKIERTQAPKLYKHTYPTFFTPAQKTINVSMKAYSGITCVNTFTKPITLKAIPIVDFSLPDGCLPNGEAVFTNLSTFVGSETGLTYQWKFGDALNSTSTQPNPTFAFKEAKSYQITLTVTAPNGSTNTLTKPFLVKGAIANPVFSVLNENSLCSDQEVTFIDNTTIAFGEINKIEWSFDNDNHPNEAQYQLTDDNPALRSASNKSYSFNYPKFSSPATQDKNIRMRITSGDNCVNEVIKTITLKAVPNVEFAPLTSVCAEVTEYQLTQANEVTGFSGKGTYSGKGIIDAGGVFSPTKAGAGTHTITYTFVGDNGCSDAKTQLITVYPTPTADAGSDKVILIGGQIVLDAVAEGNNVTYKWTPSIGLDRDDVLNPIASPLKDVTYTLTVNSEQGCTIQDSMVVKVLQFPEIPNTFTPNGDGVNDTWNIKYLDSYPSSTMRIFNRYGKEIFASGRYTPWDGKLNNEYLPEGMYYYIITAKDGELKYSGSLMLVR